MSDFENGTAKEERMFGGTLIDKKIMSCQNKACSVFENSSSHFVVKIKSRFFAFCPICEKGTEIKNYKKDGG
ncbi:MAG: hypothetical protein WC414_00255 [Patescibacteria group bacterium]